MIYDFGLTLKKLRNRKKLSQTQVANRLNLSKATISGYENNTISPSIDSLKSLAIFFNTSTDYLLGLDKKDYIIVDDLTPSQRDIIESLIREFQFTNKFINK